MAKTQGGLGMGSRPYGLGAPAMPAAAPGYGGTPSPVMGTQPGGGIMEPLTPLSSGGLSGVGSQPSTLNYGPMTPLPGGGGGQPSTPNYGPMTPFAPPSTPGVTPPGVPPQLANIWHLLSPQLQQVLGGQSPVSGLLGGFGSHGGPSPMGGIMGLLQQQQQQQQRLQQQRPQVPPPMQASGNPYPVPQSYQTPSTPLAGATMGPQGNPYQAPQTY